MLKSLLVLEGLMVGLLVKKSTRVRRSNSLLKKSTRVRRSNSVKKSTRVRRSNSVKTSTQC